MFCYTITMNSQCEVCPFLETDDSLELAARVASNEHWVATLRHNNQTLLGTTFISARRHVEALEDLDLTEELSFIELRNRVTRAQQAAFGAEVVNVMCLLNNAFQAPQPAPHVHYHLRPRYKNPVVFNGATFADPEFGYYQRRADKMPVDITMTSAIVAAMQQYLPNNG